MADMTIQCSKCQGTGELWRDQGIDGHTCGHCEGTGSINIGELSEIDDIITKLDALDTKMDTLEDHLDTIEEKIDALE